MKRDNRNEYNLSVTGYGAQTMRPPDLWYMKSLLIVISIKTMSHIIQYVIRFFID